MWWLIHAGINLFISCPCGHYHDSRSDRQKFIVAAIPTSILQHPGMHALIVVFVMDVSCVVLSKIITIVVGNDFT